MVSTGVSPGLLVRILERDDYVCHLCVELIDAELTYPHPMSGTLDHLIPRSMGGLAVPSNLAAAHRACNSWRGDAELNAAREERLGWKP